MKKDTLIIIIVIFLILAVITAFAGFCFWLFNGNSSNNQLNFSSTDISFLKSNNFNVNDTNLKSPDLIEQNLNSEDESFEVLATKLNSDSYQLAFKLENKSQQDKDFYLIPIFKENQLQFEEIKGVVNDKNTVSIKKENTSKEPLEQLYDVEKHKKELKPELAQAYEDIENNGYLAKPIKVTLSPESTFLANSNWLIDKDQKAGGLEPVYFLVYGSAGGVKEELSIITVHSHPQQGENWEVSFTTRGIADLKIIPNDQATVDDDEFVSLFCNNEEITPQILEGDVIYYPNWECLETGKVVHYTKKAGNHTLRFEFGDQVAFAYNASSVPLRVKGGLAVKGGLHIKFCASGYAPSGAGWTKIADTLVRDIAGAYNSTIAKDIYCDGDDTAGGNCILWTDGATAPGTVCITTDANVYANLLWDRKDIATTQTWADSDFSISGGDIGGTHTTNTVGSNDVAIGTKNWLERDYTSPAGTFNAMDACKAKGLGWRMPNILELDSIRDQAKGDQPYSRLPNVVSNFYLSSSEGSSTSPFRLMFGGGGVYANGAKFFAHYVRCVRGAM